MSLILTFFPAQGEYLKKKFFIMNER